MTEQVKDAALEAANAETKRYMVKVYLWMSAALIITGLVSIWTAANAVLMNFLINNEWFFITLMILEIILVGFLAGWIMNMSVRVATLIFLLYSVLNGFTLSVVFLVFTTDSIASTFFITAGTFAIMSVYGYFTKTDLTSLGNLLIMGLMGLIIASLINTYYQDDTLFWVTTYAGVLIFTGLVAFDTQKIKNLNIIGNEGSDEDKKESIVGALTLYLDFINLFLKLLQFLGRKK